MAKNLPKLEIPYNQDVRVKLTKDRPYSSTNGRGPYFLYTLLDLQNNETKALFADVSVHDAIEGKKLGAGSEIIIRKTPMSDAGKITPRFEVQVINLFVYRTGPSVCENRKTAMRFPTLTFLPKLLTGLDCGD